MKKILIFVYINILCIVIFGINNTVYSIERLVDIPVPPDNIGYADFSEEEAEKKEQELKENAESNKADKYIGKSDNNLLEKLEIEGYKLEPEFNCEQNNYTIDVKNESITKFNVIAEAKDKNAKIEGIGLKELNNGEDIININVIAENGNLNVYTIKLNNIKKIEQQEIQKVISNQDNNDKNYNNTSNLIVIAVICSVILLLIIINIKNRNKKKRKRNRR